MTEQWRREIPVCNGPAAATRRRGGQVAGAAGKEDQADEMMRKAKSAGAGGKEDQAGEMMGKAKRCCKSVGDKP